MLDDVERLDDPCCRSDLDLVALPVGNGQRVATSASRVRKRQAGARVQAAGQQHDDPRIRT